MTVYKAFVKAVMHNKWTIFMYTLIFLVISLLSLSLLRERAAEVFEISRPHILILEEGEDTAFRKALRTYLEGRAHVERTTLSKEEAIDRVVSRNQADLLVIPGENVEEKLCSGNAAIDVYYEPGSSAGTLANVEINKFFNYALAIYKTYGHFDYDRIQEMGEVQTRVVIQAREKQNINSTIFFRFYLKYFHYIFISLVLYIVTPILLQFNSGQLKTRRLVSSLRPSQYVAQVSLAILTIVIGLIAVFFLFGLGLIRFAIEMETLLLLLLNFFIFSISIVAVIILISSLNIGPSTVNTIATTLSLLIGFTSGIFVPIEFLPSSLVSVVKFFPVYHSVKVTETAEMSAEALMFHMGIQLLAAFVFMLGALYINRSRKGSSLRIDAANERGALV